MCAVSVVYAFFWCALFPWYALFLWYVLFSWYVDQLVLGWIPKSGLGESDARLIFGEPWHWLVYGHPGLYSRYHVVKCAPLPVFSPAFVGVAFLDESRLPAERVQWVVTPISLTANGVTLFQILMDSLNYPFSLDLSDLYSDEMIWGLLDFTVL